MSGDRVQRAEGAGAPRGWLVSNARVNSEKFVELREHLVRDAAGAGAELTCLTNFELAGIRPDNGSLGPASPDFVLFWDKDVALARALELTGVPVFNKPRAIEVCDDKMDTFLALAAAGVPQPDTVPVPKLFHPAPWGDGAGRAFIADAVARLGLPLVAKECYGSFGAQVHLARDEAELIRILDGFGARPALLQRFIPESAGSDVRLQVVGDAVVSAMQRTARPGDFRANLTNGGSAKPYVPDDRETEIALRACRALGLDFAGVDVLRGAGGPLVCEVNSNAHFINMERCTGVNIGALIIAHILQGIGR